MQDTCDVYLQTYEQDDKPLVDSNYGTYQRQIAGAHDRASDCRNRNEEDPLKPQNNYIDDRQGSPFLNWFDAQFLGCIDGEDKSNAAGQVIDSAAKGMLILSRGFLGPAITYLATEKALLVYCSEHDITVCSLESIEQTTPGIEEQLQVYGMKPSSLTTISKSSALAISALLLPFVGEFIDRSGHLRTTGMMATCVVACINFTTMFCSLKNFELVWISTILTDVLFQVHNMIILTYLQRLTPTVSRLSHFASKFAITQYTCMIIYISTMTIYAATTHADIIKSSSFAHGVSGSVGIVLMGYAWCFLFKDPRFHYMEKEKTVDRSSRETWIQQLSRIRRNFPALRWLIITLLFSPNTGSGSYFSIFSTIQYTFLGMTSEQIALCSLLGLLSTLVGTRLSRYVCHRFDPLISFRGAIMTFFVAILGTVIFVPGPPEIPRYFFFAAIEGLSLGWIVPTERVLLCSLTFLDETETLGLILCIHTISAWLPPLLFATINQFGFGLRMSLLSTVFLLALAILCSFGIGSFDEAAKQVRDPTRLSLR